MSQRYYVTDTDLSERFPIYTRANVGEVFPDPVTPLTSDSALWLAELGWRDGWVRMGAFEADEFPADQFAQLGVVGGYCYLNASIIRLFGERAPGMSWRDMDAQFFGAQPGIPDYVEEPGDQNPACTEKIGATFGWVFTKQHVSDIDELTEHRALTKRLRAERPDLSAMSDAELWARYEELLPLHRTLFCQHLFTTYMASVPMGLISGVATAVGRPDLILPIVAGIGDVDSAEPSHAMWAMGRQVASSPELTARFAEGVPGLLDRLRADAAAGAGGAAAAFLAAFDAFLYEYGSRGPNEWESRSPTWETRPELALSAIDRMRLAGDALAPATQNAQRATEREAAAATLLAMVEADPATHGQLAAAIACSAAWLPGRERSKTNNIRLIHEMRMPMRELGRRMVERGAFDEIEDFGFVRLAEMPSLLSDPTSLTARIRERRAEYEQLLEVEPPFVFVGQPDSGPSSWPRRDAVAVERLGVGETMVGMPAVPGSPRAVPAWCWTPTTRPRWSPATSSSPRSPIRRGRRCSCPLRPSSSTSVRR